MLKNDDKVRILHVIGSGERGGAEIFLYSLLKEMIKLPQFSIEVCFTMSRGSVADLMGDLGIKTYCLNMKSGFDLINAMKLKRLIKKRKYDIIHSHTGQLLTCLAIRLASQPLQIMTEHGSVMSDFPVRKKIERYFLRTILRSYKYLVAVSESIRKAMVIKYNVPADKIVVIRNGVRLDRFTERVLPTQELRQKLALSLHRKIVGAVARLFPEKGIDHLILAAPIVLQKHPDCLFMIAGDGPLRQELERQVKNAGPSGNFKFLGQRDDIPDLLSIMDVLVIPSVSEGMPISALEAMASGKPIVAYAVGGMPEIVDQGKTGFLVSPRSPDLLADAINILLSNAGIRLRMGQYSRERALKEFDIRTSAKRYEDLYSKVLQRRPSPISRGNNNQKLNLTTERWDTFGL
jgi:glycosyltransferase involved in cell wall biosynthesis